MTEQPEQWAIDALDTALAELRFLLAHQYAVDWAVREVAATRDALVRLFNGPA